MRSRDTEMNVPVVFDNGAEGRLEGFEQLPLKTFPLIVSQSLAQNSALNARLKQRSTHRQGPGPAQEEFDPAACPRTTERLPTVAIKATEDLSRVANVQSSSGAAQFLIDSAPLAGTGQVCSASTSRFVAYPGEPQIVPVQWSPVAWLQPVVLLKRLQ
jgi:hypothetical protein